MDRRGFTLIELLVVVVILALLISILLPALAGARESGRRSVCLSNLRSVMLGVVVYTQESNDWLPAAEPPMREFPDSQHWFMNGTLMRNLAIEVATDPDGLPVGPVGRKSILTCPSHIEPDCRRDGTKQDYALSYAANGTWGLGGRPDHLEHRRVREFVRPSEALSFTDARGVAEAPGIVLYKGCPQDNFDFRHRGRINVAWFDGHVSPVRRCDVPFGMQHRYEVFWSARMPHFGG